MLSESDLYILYLYLHLGNVASVYFIRRSEYSSTIYCW